MDHDLQERKQDAAEPRRPRQFNEPGGPDDTAEPDGQFPDDDPKVGTITPAEREDPVGETDANAEGASAAGDPDGVEHVAGPRPEAGDAGRPGAAQNTHGDRGGTS